MKGAMTCVTAPLPFNTFKIYGNFIAGYTACQAVYFQTYIYEIYAPLTMHTLCWSYDSPFDILITMGTTCNGRRLTLCGGTVTLRLNRNPLSGNL